MALPSKVKEIGDAAEQLAVDAHIKPGSKPADPQPVIAAVPAEPATPAAEQRIDPENYKERYSRYKSQTDETITELRQTLATSQATIATLQGQVTELMNKLNANPPATAPGTPAADAVPDEDAAYKKWLAKLPKKIVDEYDEGYLRDQFIIQTTAAGKENNAPPDDYKQLKEAVGHLTQVAEKTEAQLYEEAMDEAFPNDAWIKMTQEAKWGEFCAKQVSPVDNRTYGEIVKQGNDTHVASTVIWVLNEYKQYLSELDPAANTGQQPDPLMNQITPEPAGGGSSADPIGEINAQAETFTASQVNQFFKDAATTDKYSPEEYAVIEQKILAAQNAGKILPG